MKEVLRRAIIAGIVSSFIVQVIMLVVSEVLKVVASSLGLDFPFDLVQFFQLQFPLWGTLLLVSIATLTAAFYLRSIDRSKRKGVIIRVRRRPRHILQRGTYQWAGVEWNVLFGTYLIASDPYGFVESGPLCPECKYEMDVKTKTGLLGRKKKVWYCMSCGKEYDIPKGVKDIQGTVEKLVDAHFRKKKAKR